MGAVCSSATVVEPEKQGDAHPAKGNGAIPPPANSAASAPGAVTTGVVAGVGAALVTMAAKGDTGTGAASVDPGDGTLAGSVGLGTAPSGQLTTAANEAGIVAAAILNRQTKKDEGGVETIAGYGLGGDLRAAMEPVVDELGSGFRDAIEVLESLFKIVESAPLVGAIGAALLAGLMLVRKVSANRTTCQRLAQRMLHVGRLVVRADELARSDTGPRGQRLRALFEPSNPTIAEVSGLLDACKATVERYSGQSWWRAVIVSGSDKAVFEALDLQLDHASRAMVDEVQLETAFAAFAPSAEDEVRSSIAARVRKEKGMAEVSQADLESYVSDMEREGRAKELMAALSTSDNVLYGALTQAMGEGVAEVSRRLDDTRVAIQQSIDANHQQLLKKLDSLGNWRQGLDAMSPPLRAFWEAHTDGSSIPWPTLRRLILATVPDLFQRCTDLCHHEGGVDPAGGLQADEFLDSVVRRSLDQDGNDLVTATELHVFSVECRGLAERHADSIKAWPSDEEGSLPWCLTILRQSYNVSDLDPERAAGLAELNDKIHPLNFQAEINAHAASFVKGTREWLFREVNIWLSEPSNRTLVLVGAPGLGKSAFAAQLSVRRKDAIKCKIFCRHDESSRRSTRNLIRTIAFQLAQSVPDLWRPILAAAKGVAVDAPPDLLFRRLVQDPLCALDSDATVGPNGLVILIDALDEAESGGLNPMSSLLVNQLETLPAFVRFVVTSRAVSRGNQDLVALLSGKFRCRIIPEDHPRHSDDLKIFTESRLRRHVSDSGLLARGTKAVLSKASGSFVYVSNVLREFIEPRARSKSSTGGQLDEGDFDALPASTTGHYLQELRKRIASNPDVLDVLRIMVVVREAPFIFALAALVNRPLDDSFVKMLEQLHPFFEIQGANISQKRLVPQHQTVIEFLTNPDQAKELYLDPIECERDLTGALTVRVRRDLNNVDITSEMSWHLPCYAARHAFGHALNANMLDEATEIVSNPRYLKLLCEYGSMRQCKMELEAHEATLSPPLKQVLDWLTASDLDVMEEDPTLAMVKALEAPEGSIVRTAAEALKADCEARIRDGTVCDPNTLNIWRLNLVKANRLESELGQMIGMAGDGPAKARGSHGTASNSNSGTRAPMGRNESDRRMKLDSFGTMDMPMYQSVFKA